MANGYKISTSWILLCSLLCMWTSVECWSYFHSDTRMGWEKARTWCREHYTDMVAIQNKEEIEHLNTWLPPKPGYYWIGIRKINDVWTWVGTNKTLTKEATNWAKDEPNNGHNGPSIGKSEDCVEMYIKRTEQTGKWNDEWCEKLKTALCYSAACKNDSCLYGECVETINSHKCVCTPGFYGEKCEQVVKCSKEEVIIPDKGSVNCTHTYGNFSYDSLCQYSCEEGYKPSTPSPLRCTATGNWSEQPPTCELVQCQQLSHPLKGSLKYSNPSDPFSYRSTCVFTCDEGYELDGFPSNTLRCESSGNWNASQPSCVAVQCPALQELENGVVSCDNDTELRFSNGKTCSFSCVSGYHLVGPSSVSCSSAAEWSEQMPRCEAITCQNPEGEGHLITDCSKPLTELGPNSTCSFSCEAGFELQGSNPTRCSEDGQWNEAIPTCKAVQCPALQELENGVVSCDSDTELRFSYGKTCSFSCVSGYRLVGPSSVSCSSAAEWSEQMPRCEAISCQNPEGEGHLITDCSKPLTELGPNSTCSFSCEPGFELQGSTTTKCSEDGQWNEAIPTCKAVRCLLLKDPENGHINCSNSEPVFNTQCSFTCDQDYSLDGHELLTCDRNSSWSGKKPTCQAPWSSSTVITTSVTAGATALASGLSIAMWILKRLKRKSSKFELNSNSDIESPPQVYKNSTDSLV